MDNQQKISDLSLLSIQDMNGSENIAMSTPKNNGGYESKKNSFSRLGSWFSNCFNFNNLNTESKNIIGAINESKQGGMNLQGAAAHNAICRGKWLGTAPTEAQYQTIYDGTFDDIYIGDFWSEDPDDPSKPRWRVAGLNYYYGTGQNDYVTTNHAVIIPDVAILTNKPMIESSGLQYDAGYKYSYMRGYKAQNYSGSTTVNGDTVTVHLSHIPTHITAIRGMTTMYINGDPTKYFGPELMYTASSYGEDPNNPGQGIITFNRNNYGVFWNDSNYSDPPSSWTYAEPNLPSYVDVFYQYYDETYNTLSQAKSIIEDTFGAEHIMHHKIPLTTYGVTLPTNKIYDIKNNLADFQFTQEWTDVTVEIPTAECIMGNSSLSVFNEYRSHEYFDQAFRGAPLYLQAQDSQYGYSEKNYSFPDVERFIKNNGKYMAQSHVEMNQLPLFVYDPSLIHTRQAYWFRNIAYSENADRPDSHYLYYNPRHYYMFMNGTGTQWGYEYNTYNNCGIRPIFCISATSNPHES